MGKVLIGVGLQEEKKVGNEKQFNKICEYFDANADSYDKAINIVRVKNYTNRNSSGKDDIINYRQSSKASVLGGLKHELHGFTIEDETMFSMHDEYYIVGGSLGLAIMGLVLQMYGMGLNVKVIEKYTFDRKGMEKHARAIFDAYMPGVLI